MKKRMLVTTIALVLVIAVALTTSSLAWFSSSSAVTTGTVDFTAVSATGTNLVLGNYGETNLTLYGNSVTFPVGGTYNPVQGKVTFEGEDAIEETNNQLAFAENPFYTPTEKGVVQVSGYDVQSQKVTFEAAGDDDYYAGGFNFANATGDAISGGVTLNATITLDTFDADVAADAGKVKKGYVAYEDGWKNAGDDVTASAVFFEAQDVALMASIRIAVCGAANVLTATTYDDDLAKIYAWGDKGFTLDNTGYALTTGASQTKYVPGVPSGDKVYTDATDTYGTITGITYANGKFTFSYSFAQDISADNAGSIAFVIWMDGWDESALPGVSEGDFTIGFELTK